MAACESLQHIFEQPLPNPTLLEPFSSWHQIKSMKPIEQSSFTEIFGQLNFKQNPELLSSSSPLPLLLSSPSSSSSIYINTQAQVEKLNNEGNKKSPSSSSDYFSTSHRKQYLGSHKNSDSFSSVNSDSFQLCTEGLGFESSDDVEDLMSNMDNHWQNQERTTTITKHTHTLSSENLCCAFKRSSTSGGAFPPPISSIGKSGKPCVCFKSYRHNGRFVLKEIRIPTQEFLHAYREGGRLKLHLVQSDDDEILEEDQEEEEGEDDIKEEDEDKENEETHGDDNHDSNKNGYKGENDDAKNVEINENKV